MSKIDGKAWKTLLTSNEVLARYGNNAIGLLALTLRFDIDDIALAGVESFVDGSNDKKNDVGYIDEERGIADVIQAVTEVAEPENIWDVIEQMPSFPVVDG